MIWHKALADVGPDKIGYCNARVEIQTNFVTLLFALSGGFRAAILSAGRWMTTFNGL